jgi:hypothetical protein
MQEEKRSSKFYQKSLISFVSILEMIEEGITYVQIARELQLAESHVSYFVKKGSRLGYIDKTVNNKPVLTQPGKIFLERYEKLNASPPVCRVENMRFKARVIKMPPIPLNWKVVHMHNWVAYTSEVDNVKIKLNMGVTPTIEFMPSPIEGDNPYHLFAVLFYACSEAAQRLSDSIGIEIGTLQSSSRAEWLVYDPIARSFCKTHGQVTYEGLAKVNASKPRQIGEFEFHDPRALNNYLLMPQRVKKIERMLTELSETVQQLLQTKNTEQSSNT